MGLDYALVHVKYTIPPAVVLTLLYRPLLTQLDVYKICFLVTIAVVSTIPWDSYLIRTRIWSYPDDAVLGYTLFDIPLEELFFFIIQTYDVCMIYLCFNKPKFHPAYIPHSIVVSGNSFVSQCIRRAIGIAGQLFFVIGIIVGSRLIYNGGEGTYMGLIVVWSFPFLLLLWTLSNQFLLRLPYVSYAYPIFIPTLYLWLVDTFSLKRGTWVIETGTKLGVYIWDGLELEEAFFFLVTNTLIVFGLTAFSHAVAIIDGFPRTFPESPSLPSPQLLVKSLLTPSKNINGDRIVGFNEALTRLQQKSRSFYLASSTFNRRLRIDLILLYSFCRVADDLVDGAATSDEARLWISRLHKYLDFKFASNTQDLQILIDTEFPSDVRRTLSLLPASQLSKQPLYDLLKGFELDLEFTSQSRSTGIKWPIASSQDLEVYGYYVAGTVAELCLDLVFRHSDADLAAKDLARIKQAGATMGIALQTINIARDIEVDAHIERVYIPTGWLREEGLSPDDVLTSRNSEMLPVLRTRLLDLAFERYEEARPAIEELPQEVRGPMRVAIESYIEIGRVLRSETYVVKAGRATVPKTRRVWVAWKALVS